MFTQIQTRAPVDLKRSLYTFRESHKSLLIIGQRRKNITANKQTVEEERKMREGFRCEIFSINLICNE